MPFRGHLSLSPPVPVDSVKQGGILTIWSRLRVNNTTMRSVERRFSEFKKSYPSHSTFVVFGRTIQGQHFTQRAIASHFRKLVAKDDYAPNDKNRLLKHMTHLTKLADECKKTGVVGGSQRSFTVSPYTARIKA